MQVTENQRLKIFLNELGLSQKEFASIAGMQQGSLSDVIRAKNGIKVSEGIKYKLENLYNLNRQWLETGLGDMFKEKSIDLRSKSNTLIVGEIQNPDDESSFIDIGNGQYIMVVPIVPIKAQAGYIQNYNDEQYIHENFTQMHSFAVDRVYRGKYMAFIIDGDSMDDGTSGGIIEGSTVTGREIQKSHWKNKFHIHRYKDYVIVHKDGIFTKRITHHDIDKGIITCNSLNPNKDLYADFDLSLDDCLQIFNIVNVTQPR